MTGAAGEVLVSEQEGLEGLVVLLLSSIAFGGTEEVRVGEEGRAAAGLDGTAFCRREGNKDLSKEGLDKVVSGADPAAAEAEDGGCTFGWTIA
jgi:hypothetical protein